MKKEKNQLQKNEIELVKMENFLTVEEKIEPHSKEYEKIMFIYEVAIKEMIHKLEIIQQEFKLFYDYDMIDHINQRVKTPESIYNKMKDRGYDYTYQKMIQNINDIAGIRVVCPLEKDIFSIRNLVKNLPGVRVVKEKDYITKPKKSGYASYHLILEVPVTLSQKLVYVKVEIQIRTMAMDFWSSFEHKMKYKANGEKISEKTSKELVTYAKMVHKLEHKMMLLNQ